FNEAPWIVGRIADSLGTPFHADFTGGSGMTLRQHYDRGKALAAIRDGHYDFVVIQPQSSEIVQTQEETFGYARLLVRAVKAAHAEPILMLTWAPRESRDNQAEYTRRYRTLGRASGVRIAPVGIAWERLQAHGINLFADGQHPNVAGS